MDPMTLDEFHPDTTHNPSPEAAAARGRDLGPIDYAEGGAVVYVLLSPDSEVAIRADAALVHCCPKHWTKPPTGDSGVGVLFVAGNT